MKNLTLLIFAVLALNACSFGGVEDELRAQAEMCESMKGVYTGEINSSEGTVPAEMSIDCKSTNNGTDSRGRTRILKVMGAQVRIYDSNPKDISMTALNEVGNFTLTTEKSEANAQSTTEKFSFDGLVESDGSISGIFKENFQVYGKIVFKRAFATGLSTSNDLWNAWLDCYNSRLRQLVGEYTGTVTPPASSPYKPYNVVLRVFIEEMTAETDKPRLRAFFFREGTEGSLADRAMNAKLVKGNRVAFSTPKEQGNPITTLEISISGAYKEGVIVGSLVEKRFASDVVLVNKNWVNTPIRCN